MNSLKDSGVLANVAARGETESTNQTSTHVTNNISVEVGQDHHIELSWICGKLEVSLITFLGTTELMPYAHNNVGKGLLLVFDIRELGGYLGTSLNEEAVSLGLDVGQVDGGHLVCWT